MFVQSVQQNRFQNFYCLNQNRSKQKNIVEKKFFKPANTQLSIGFNSLYNVNFGSWYNPNRLVGDVDFETYQIMNERAKERYRCLYDNFSKNEEIEQSQLFDKRSKALPLKNPKTMEKFLDVSKIYLKYKDQPIICLGRSPKWFLDTASWMKDGIKDYKFVAFSKYWYRKDPNQGIVKIQSDAPTEEEEKAYRKYLDRIGVTPQKIVDTMKETGKKTIITDYICTGKGACSFLDVLSRYAEEQGCLEEFSKSIEFVGIGSMEYMEELDPYAESISIPRVPMPPLLKPYNDNIKQVFYNIDYNVFSEILLDRNTNECRSSYYPPDAWTKYSPDIFKTGLIDDMSFVEIMKNKFKDDKYIITFTAPMQDYRNLLNFRILDYLNEKELIRPKESEYINCTIKRFF